MLVNKIGISKNSEFYTESDHLCGINLKQWYLYYTILVGVKLLLTAAKYYFLKRNRKENISLFLVDLILMNVLFSVLFISANVMYFSQSNSCYYTNDQYIRAFYMMFCVFTLLGYAQFIYCILLACAIPLSALIIYKLVEYRLMSVEA